MNIELSRLKEVLLEAAQACNDPVAIVEFRIEEAAGVTEPFSRTIAVKYWVKGE